jgi:organic radical activating enzyme
MMNVAIVTWGDKGRELYRLIKQHGDIKYNIRCIMDSNCSLWGKTPDNLTEIVSSSKSAKLYFQKQIDKFIIPCVSEGGNSTIYNLLSAFKAYQIPMEDILYAPIELFENDALSGPEKLREICAFEQRRDLEAMEVHVTDHCNMHCINCTMVAGLVKKPVFIDYDKTEADLRQLKKFFDHIKIFRVLGGEPLLHPNLDRFLSCIRGFYPYTILKLSTNGTLVKKMNPQLLESLRKNRVLLGVSHYLSIANQIDSIHKFLKENQIDHWVSPLITSFRKVYNAAGTSDMDFMFKSCGWRRRGCETMWNGRIAACFVPFVIPYLSDYFDLNIPISGTIDLYQDGLTTQKIRELLSTPFETCKYCAYQGHNAPWRTYNEQSRNSLKSWSI